MAPVSIDRAGEVRDRAYAAGRIGWGEGYLHRFRDHPEIARKAFAKGRRDRKHDRIAFQAQQARMRLDWTREVA
jgi:hypothetical protein